MEEGDDKITCPPRMGGIKIHVKIIVSKSDREMELLALEKYYSYCLLQNIRAAEHSSRCNMFYIKFHLCPAVVCLLQTCNVILHERNYRNYILQYSGRSKPPTGTYTGTNISIITLTFLC